VQSLPSGEESNAAAGSIAPWTGGSPDDYVGWTLIQAGHALNRHFEVLLGHLGLTPMQFGALVQLSLRPDLSSGQLARLVLVTPQSMGELIHSLERAGWVAREQGVGRGRRVRIRVTAAGHGLLRRATPIAGALNVAEVLGLTVAERWLLNSLLHKVRDAMTAPEFRDNVLARMVADGSG